MEYVQLLGELLFQVHVDKLVENSRLDSLLFSVDIDNIFSDEYRRRSAIARRPTFTTGRVTKPTTTRSVEPYLSVPHVKRLENAFHDVSHAQIARVFLTNFIS